MQTHDVQADIVFKLWPWFEANRNRLIGGVVVGFIAVGVYSFVTWRGEQKEIAAGEALTALLATPANGNTAAQADSLVKFAAENSGTAAGERAQLQGATELFTAGRYADAQVQFQKFVERTGSGTLAASAQLGLAASLEAQGKLDLAIAAFQKVVSMDSTASPSAQTAKAALGRLQKPVASAVVQPAAKPNVPPVVPPAAQPAAKP